MDQPDIDPAEDSAEAAEPGNPVRQGEMQGARSGVGEPDALAADPPAFAPAWDEGFFIVPPPPGVKADDVQIDVDKGVLTLSGERKLVDQEKKEGYHRVERFYGSFRRSFQLPDTVDVESIDAEMKDGILTLTLPKNGKASPRKVSVRSAD